MKAAFLTLGCKVNFYETEKMVRQFRDRGFEIVDFTERADVYVVNTCTVTNIADRKSRQMLHRAKKMNPDGIVVAAGCYVESAGESVLGDAAVDAVFSNREKADIADRVIERFGLQNGCGSQDSQHPAGRTRAYLKIQDGCNQFCSYCIIPSVRGGGKLTSMPVEEALRQLRELSADGYREVVLTGIHLSSYGVDFSDGTNFVKLGGKPLLDVIRAAAQVEGIERIRLGSLEPRIISEQFLEELAGIPKICPHFHLSLQSGCDSVLRRMNRHYTTVEYSEKVNLLRRYFENPAVTTDVIVGFPGETEEEFDETERYLEELKLSDMHVFRFSPRSGTRAASMEGQVRPEIKNARSTRLVRIAERQRQEYGDYFLGREEKILFEEVVPEGGREYLAGHNERYVKIGVPVDEAEKAGYGKNRICSVVVKKVLKK